eukprot:TRINITY_DN95430_c0_g1_i1.p1 TRINITY_DN95430_c0_g1~~TRINITY_DN95430_c0_g1_i1.p1  ORF type:complete len:577 (+),score=178.78 TRINITY_DN95430_c0_g1_i1:64-1731(+)
MAFPSLEDLLAELDKQDAMEESTQEEVKLDKQGQLEAAIQQDARSSQLQEQAGGSSSSCSERRRRGGRFSQLCTAGHNGLDSMLPAASRSSPEDAPQLSAFDGKLPQGAGSVDDSGESTACTEAMHVASTLAEDPQGSLPEFSELISQLDVDALHLERKRAQAEAVAFEERQRRSKQEAERKAEEEQQRRVDAAREEQERLWMAAEEAEERRRRANRYASVLEEQTRRQATKQMQKRQKEREDAKKQRRIEKERRKEERLRSEAAEMSQKIRRMAENGYTLGPNGWVRLDWLSPQGAAWGAVEAPQAPNPRKIDTSSEEGDGRDITEDDAPYEVVDQQPLPASQQAQPEVLPLEDVLAHLDQQQVESWASAADAPDLGVVLEVLDAFEGREREQQAATSVRQSFQELGKVEAEEEEDALPPDSTATAANVLNAAKTRRPDGDFCGAINAESSLQPWNDFVEEKQEGENSYEERQARSAAIQAKLQAARNRFSLVRYERSSVASAPAEPQRGPAPDERPPQSQRAMQGLALPSVGARGSIDAGEGDDPTGEPSGWG